MTFVNVNNKDIKLLQRRLDKLKSKSKVAVSTGIGKWKQGTENDAKRAAKFSQEFSKGFLRQSIQGGVTNKSAYVEASAKYAPYVEFGTGRKVDLSHLEKMGIKKSYAEQFKGRGIKDVNLPARPFLYPAAFNNLRFLLQYLKNEIKKL